MAVFAAAREKQLQRIKTAIADGKLDKLKGQPDLVLQQVAEETVKRRFAAASPESKASSAALAKAKGRAAALPSQKESQSHGQKAKGIAMRAHFGGDHRKNKAKKKAAPPAESQSPRQKEAAPPSEKAKASSIATPTAKEAAGRPGILRKPKAASEGRKASSVGPCPKAASSAAVDLLEGVLWSPKKRKGPSPQSRPKAASGGPKRNANVVPKAASERPSLSLKAKSDGPSQKKGGASSKMVHVGGIVSNALKASGIIESQLMDHLQAQLLLKRPAGASARPAPESAHPAPEPLPSSDEEPCGTAPIAGPAPVPLAGGEKRKCRRVQQKVEAKMLKRETKKQMRRIVRE